MYVYIYKTCKCLDKENKTKYFVQILTKFKLLMNFNVASLVSFSAIPKKVLISLRRHVHRSEFSLFPGLLMKCKLLKIVYCFEVCSLYMIYTRSTVPAASLPCQSHQ